MSTDEVNNLLWALAGAVVYGVAIYIWYHIERAEERLDEGAEYRRKFNFTNSVVDANSKLKRRNDLLEKEIKHMADTQEEMEKEIADLKHLNQMFRKFPELRNGTPPPRAK